jgi:hypothetical protein
MDSKEEEDVLQKIRKYVHHRYYSHIKGDTIFYGKASFPVDMLVTGSLDTFKANSDRDLHFIVDYMFDYFCT